MVVNRKRPVVPAPPISRTASSQPLPTKKQTRSSNASAMVHSFRDDQKSNGHRFAKSPSGGKLKPEKKRNSKSLIDYLILFLLSGFSCYSLYVCRPNPLFSSSSYGPQPPLCRALATYHTHVVEPYLLPPIKQTLHYAHKLSEPYLEQAQIWFSPYLEPAKNVIDTVTPHAESSIRTTQNIWKNSVIPIYTQTLQPYYETAIVPRYIRYVRPLLVPLGDKIGKLYARYVFNPVRLRTNFFLHKLHQLYTLHVDPYLRIARPYIRRISNTTCAVAVDLYTVYTTYLHPPALKVCSVAYSAFGTAWKQFFRLFFRFTDVIYAYLKWIAREVGIYRRQYVDRHVDRILEQVTEPKANGNYHGADSTSSLVDATRTGAEAQKSFESGTSSPIVAASIFDAPSQTSSSSMDRGEAAWADSVETTVPIPLESKTLADSSMDEENADKILRETRKEFDSVVDSDFTQTPSPSSTLFDEASSTTGLPLTSESPSGTIPGSDPDLDEFLRDLGVGEQATTVLNTPEEASEPLDMPSVRPKTEEERLAETAARRADIVDRHEKWFEKLHARVRETGDGLVKILQALRDDAAEDVRHLGTHPSKADPSDVDDEPVKDARSIIWVEQDGQKLVRGLEVYLRKAEGRCDDWKLPKDTPDDNAKKAKQDVAAKEKEKWLDIVSKVESKFSARVDDVRSQVHKWYVDLKEREVAEVVRSSQIIKDLATQAQEDLGMDYAWLDDVTYLDWQRYHDLMRVYDSFAITVRQITNGTSTDPIPPSDPVVVALDDLDRDLQDIIIGFNYALSGMRSRGLKVFNSRPLNGENNDEEHGDGFFVVKDDEKRVVDLRDVDLSKIEMKKEAVGILPTKRDSDESIGILPIPNEQPDDSDSGLDASKIIIGKDKSQVEEALRDIPFKPPANRHTEL